MANITISKSDKTIEKEEKEAKVEAIKNKSSVSNADLKELLLMLLEKMEG